MLAQTLITMAGKSIVLFIRSVPNFGLDGEPSLANLALAIPAVEKEAMHIANTPLAFLPAPGKKMGKRGASHGVM